MEHLGSANESNRLRNNQTVILCGSIDVNGKGYVNREKLV